MGQFTDFRCLLNGTANAELACTWCTQYVRTTLYKSCSF